MTIKILYMLSICCYC